jgi:NAD(P)-dependent dehydrogenase (short-subunit alcohol dehydrogenase family)
MISMTSSILITGCSSGIGLATALALHQRGYRVFAGARKMEDVNKLRELGLTALPLDVDHNDSIQQAIDKVLSATGGTLDALFNNAGFMLAGAAEDMTRSMMERQFATNTFGAMEMTRLVLPIMRKQGHGRILQNSSILGIITLPYYSAYNASKFALEGYSNTLRQELCGSGIHVSIICPGPIYSKLRDNAFEQYQATLQNNHVAAYDQVYSELENTYFKRSQRGDQITQSPDAVVKKVLHALESKRPYGHYYVGVPAFSMAVLRRLLPDSALDWIANKIR